MTRLILVGPLLMAACTGFPIFGREVPKVGAADVESTAHGRREGPLAALELQDTQYDGTWLSGRLLVGALVDGLRLDKRLFSNIHVNVGSVRDCADQEVPYVVMDYFIPPPRQEDLLILNRGYWYGAPAQFRLFVEPGPECINVELSLLSFEGKRVGSVQVRAERVPLQAMDAGIPKERQPTDAGIP